ncbi:MAG: polysaccharide export protein [Xanthobacteraceae bacterium]|nr:polysaccharide export protein [Xanthobacteraceae bacterium]
MVGRLPNFWLLLPVGFAIVGCTSLAQVREADQQQIITESISPRLQAGEKIRVNVYGESSLSGDYQIDPSGYLSLPLAGNIKAAGLTQNELAQALATSLRSQYLKNPRVTISVAEFRPFYIIGEIQKPGSYPYTSGLNVLSAVAIAGGTTYRASRSSILIQHPGDAGLREYALDASVPILPGDIIKVPQRYF